MEKDLNYWLQELQTNPSSLVPLLLTPEGRKLLQISSMENAVIGLWHAMEDKGMAPMECRDALQPLFAQVPLSRAQHAFHLDREPNVFFAWWCTTHPTCPPAWRVDGADRTLDTSSALVGSMAWTLLCNNMRSPPKTLVPNALKEQLHQLIDASGDNQHIVRNLATQPVPDVSDVYTRRCWEKLMNSLTPQELVSLAPVFQVVIHPGAMAAFVGRCQQEPLPVMDRIVDALPEGLLFPVQSFHQNHPLRKKTWLCPMHGLLLVPSWAKQPDAGVQQDPNVQALLDMNTALGVDATATMLRTQIRQILKPTPAPSLDMEHAALADAFGFGES